MTQFCGNCGAARSEGRFCASCGQPYGDAAPQAPIPGHPATGATPQAVPQGFAPAPPQPPAAQAVPPQAAPPQAAPPQAGQPQWAPPQAGQPQWAPTAQAPGVPKVNPFAGVPISDYVRDGVALIFLFSTLGVLWDLQNDGSDRWWVVIAVLFSVASLAVPYVLASRLIPGWTHQHALFTKVGLNVPLAASVVAALINEAINIDNTFAGGLGHGVAFAVLGATLAVQPRANDESPTLGYDRFWLLLSKSSILAVAIAASLYFVRLLVNLIGDGSFFEDLLQLFAEFITWPVMLIAVLGVPAALALNGSVWRRVFATGAFGVLTAALFSHIGDSSVIRSSPVESWDSPTTSMFLFALAAGASISHAAQRQTVSRVEPARGWVDTARYALMISAAGIAVTAFATLVTMITYDVEAAPIVLTVLLLAAAALAGAAAMLLQQVVGRRPVALGLIGGVMLLGIILAAVANAQGVATGLYQHGFWYATGVVGLTPLAVAAFFALPGLALYALVVPQAVRTALGPVFPQPTSAPQGQPQWAPPAQEQPQQPQQPPQWTPPASGQPDQGAGQPPLQ